MLSGHDIGLEPLDGIQGVDTLCLFVGEDERPLQGLAGLVDWRLCGGLSRVLVNRFFTGSDGEQLLLPANGRIPMARIFAVGGGPRASLSGNGLGRLLSDAATMLNRAKVDSVALEVPGAGFQDDATRWSMLQRSFLKELWARRVAVLAEKGLKVLVCSKP